MRSSVCARPQDDRESGALKGLLSRCGEDDHDECALLVVLRSPMSAAGQTCPDGPEVQLPLYPRKRTQLGHRAMSEKCQTRKSSLHSITTSARPSSVGGTARPSAFAVFKLITNSNLVGCSTGRSAGLAPFRTRLTSFAERR